MCTYRRTAFDLCLLHRRDEVAVCGRAVHGEETIIRTDVLGELFGQVEDCAAVEPYNAAAFSTFHARGIDKDSVSATSWAAEQVVDG
jgi:hypothetical protein